MRATCFGIAILFTSPILADDAVDLLGKADAALKKKDFADAVKLATKAIEAGPKNSEGFDLRGEANFKLGNIKESLADFDKQIELTPRSGPKHWRRGLTLYYAEKFADGVTQFTSSDKAAPEDVENAVWHFLCNARVKNVEKARAEILKVAKDPRGEYMMQIYKMFKGEAKPEDVFKSAEAGKVADALRQEQRFYANYYVSMYYEAIGGEAKKSLEHMKIAVEKYPIGHYMMDVAKVHLKLRPAN